MKTKRIGTKAKAAILAGILSIAIIVIGTLAWRSISQENINEFLVDRNPGGRLHDDFNGTNKDVYVENFTDESTGSPIFARVRLREYMEVGDDAGFKRDDAGRSAEPLVFGSDINEVDSWHVHDFVDDMASDPFHDYWNWYIGGRENGRTVYMPTFNKNRDSLAVDVNGSYVGADGVFETGVPYDDYVSYALNETKTANAYYDADDDDLDEDPTQPGCGGVEDTDYVSHQETHIAKRTRDTAGVISMATWEMLGCPLGDYWVCDVDGWCYWAIPVFPGQATGLLLDKVVQTRIPSGKCYYAIDVVGQFASESDWGSPATEDDPATGFYEDGITDDALDLLNRAIKVVIGGDNKLYLSIGNNVYKPIMDHTGEVLEKMICAGPDRIIGTPDDIYDVEMLERPIIVDGIEYYGLVIKATAGKPYYRATGPDENLGTDDDMWIWNLDTDDVYTGTLVSHIVDSVEITGATGAVSASVGGTLNFSAAVNIRDIVTGMSTYDDATKTVNGIALDGVEWSVKGAQASGTMISDGVLTVSGDESAKIVTVVATSKADGRVRDLYPVTILTRMDVVVTSEGDATTVQAGKDLNFSAAVLDSGTFLPDAHVEWAVAPAVSGASVDDGNLSLTKAVSAGTNITVQATYEDIPNGRTITGSRTVRVLPADPALVTVTATGNASTVKANDTLAFSATVEGVSNSTVTWSLSPAVSGVSINSATGVLSVGSGVKAGTAITVKATPTSIEAGGSSGTKRVTVAGPKSVTVTRTDVSENVNVAHYYQNPTFTATVKDENGNNYPVQDVVWTLTAASGSTIGSGTSLSQSGVLTIGEGQTNSSSLTITAKSKTDATVLGQAWVQIKRATVPMAVGTRRIGRDDYYILYNDTANNRQLVLSKNSLVNRKFDDTKLSWSSSDLRNYLNNKGPYTKNGFLTSHKELGTMAIELPVFSRTSAKGGFVTTLDRVFLLTESDIYGTYANGLLHSKDLRDYTLGSVLGIPAGFSWGPISDAPNLATSWKSSYNGGEYGWRLRNAYDSKLMSNVTSKGACYSFEPYKDLPVRVAAWVPIS